MNRRKFIETSFLGGTALTLFNFLSCGQKGKQTEFAFPRRKLGRTGEMLSIIGFGGILVDRSEQQVANNIVAKAFDRGINYFDVAPTYGNAQDRLGPALKPYRKNCFLACKTTERLHEGTEKELHDSLKKLKTDHFDLYQLHALTTRDDVEQAFGPGGAMEVFFKAKQDGKIRFIGFSAHSEEAAILAMENYRFDTILFPINFVCWYQGNFGPRVVERARAKQMGILALKALAFTKICEGEEKPYPKLWYVPINDDEIADLALRFTLSQGTTAAIPPGEEKFFWKAVEIAQKFAPLTIEEMERLKAISEGVEPLFRSA
jgi:predicted aldo/keto reductase-like oxidoreductase